MARGGEWTAVSDTPRTCRDVTAVPSTPPRRLSRVNTVPRSVTAAAAAARPRVLSANGKCVLIWTGTAIVTTTTTTTVRALGVGPNATMS